MSPAVDVDTLEPWKEKCDITLANCGLCRPSSIAWLFACTQGWLPAEMWCFRWHLELVVSITSAAKPGLAIKMVLCCRCVFVSPPCEVIAFLCHKGHRITLSHGPLWCLCWRGMCSTDCSSRAQLPQARSTLVTRTGRNGMQAPLQLPLFLL